MTSFPPYSARSQEFSVLHVGLPTSPFPPMTLTWAEVYVLPCDGPASHPVDLNGDEAGLQSDLRRGLFSFFSSSRRIVIPVNSMSKGVVLKCWRCCSCLEKMTKGRGRGRVYSAVQRIALPREFFAFLAAVYEKCFAGPHPYEADWLATCSFTMDICMSSSTRIFNYNSVRNPIKRKKNRSCLL